MTSEDWEGNGCVFNLIASSNVRGLEGAMNVSLMASSVMDVVSVASSGNESGLTI